MNTAGAGRDSGQPPQTSGKGKDADNKGPDAGHPADDKGNPPLSTAGRETPAGNGAVAATAMGNLVVDAAPWANVERIERVGPEGVEVVGSREVTPLSMSLPVGDYRIRLERNGVRQTRTVSLAERSTRSVHVTFERVDATQFLSQAQP